MNRIARLLKIASSLEFFYRLERDNILLIARSPDESTTRMMEERAKDLKGIKIRRSTRLPSAYKGVWYKMPDDKESAALSYFLREEFGARPM